MSGGYKCSLSAKSIEKAEKELNENPNERQGAVDALREWTEREPWITSPSGCIFESRCEKTCIRGFMPRSDTNRTVQSQKMVRGLIFQIKK